VRLDADDVMERKGRMVSAIHKVASMVWAGCESSDHGYGRFSDEEAL